MRPVSDQWQVTQNFGEGATGGVLANSSPASGVGYLVWLFGDYQHDGHAGTDVGCNVGTPIRAARSGTVLWCDWDVHLPGGDWWGPGGYFDRWAFYKKFGGRLTVIQHAPGDLDVYAHQSEWKVTKGQFVQEGDLIGLSGDSSAGQDGQLGPHLHTERIVDTATYATGNGMIYGRIDPTPVWGINAQGNITPVQEDDVITPEDIKAIEDAIIWGKRPKYNAAGQEIGTTTLGETIAWQESNFLRQRQLTIDSIKETVIGVLTTPVTNVATGGTTSLGSEASWAAWNAKRPTDGGVDTNAVADAIAQAIAAKLTAAPVPTTPKAGS